MAAHALSDTDREVYGLIYEQNNRIQKYHPIQSEEHVLRKPRRVSFTGNFKAHVRRLAYLYDELELRLAGDCHSHPMSGVPTPSDKDLKSFKKFWQNERNTYFIIGLNDGVGPDEWTHFEDGHELRRTIDGHLVRIKAYGVEGESKLLILPDQDSDTDHDHNQDNGNSAVINRDREKRTESANQ